MVETMYLIDNMPSVLRYPRGSGYGEKALKEMYVDVAGTENESAYVNGEMPKRGKPLPIGKGRLIKYGKVICHLDSVTIFLIYMFHFQ